MFVKIVRIKLRMVPKTAYSPVKKSISCLNVVSLVLAKVEKNGTVDTTDTCTRPPEKGYRTRDSQNCHKAIPLNPSSKFHSKFPSKFSSKFP